MTARGETWDGAGEGAWATAPTGSWLPDARHPDARHPDGGWIDLDVEPADPVRPRQPFRGVLLLAAVAGLVLGGVLAVTSEPGLPSPPPSVVAWVTLDALMMEPVPTAVLRVTVDNRGTSHQNLRDVAVSGGGTTGITRPIGRVVAPSRQTDELVPAPLACPRGASRSDQVSVVVRVAREGGGGPVTVPAVAVGRAAEVDGLCTAADASLPGGWRTPAHAASWRITGDELDVTVTGMPADLVRLVAVEADGVLMPQPRVADRTRSGDLHLVVGPATLQCRDGGLRPVVATGVQLRVETSTGLGDVYLPLGAEVAQWMMDTYARACPAKSGGPPAVGVAYGG